MTGGPGGAKRFGGCPAVVPATCIFNTSGTQFPTACEVTDRGLERAHEVGWRRLDDRGCLRQGLQGLIADVSE